jgi:DNA-directed RNA polymerase subunit omega
MINPLSLLPEDSLKRFDSRHRLVIAASQRAKHLMQGAKPAVAPKFHKETTIALDEVLHGHVEFLTGADARQAIKDTKRGQTELERLAVAEQTEDAREIKKELSQYVDDSVAEPEAESEE